jgi:hypothetical protein
LLWEYRLRWGEMSALSEVERAALVAVAFCENELNCLYKILINSMNRPTEEVLQEVSDIQRNTVLRIVTGKLFEFLELYGKISSAGQGSAPIKATLSELKVEQRACRNHPGYKIAKAIRNEQSNHYGFDGVVQRSKRQIDDISCNSFMAHQRGNSFYPYAEHFVFNPDPAGRLENEIADEEKETMMADWIDWSLKATDLVRSTHNSLFKNLISARFPSRVAHSKWVWYEPASQGNPDSRLPLFFGPQQ